MTRPPAIGMYGDEGGRGRGHASCPPAVAPGAMKSAVIVTVLGGAFVGILLAALMSGCSSAPKVKRRCALVKGGPIERCAEIHPKAKPENRVQVRCRNLNSGRFVKCPPAETVK